MNDQQKQAVNDKVIELWESANHFYKDSGGVNPSPFMLGGKSMGKEIITNPSDFGLVDLSTLSGTPEEAEEVLKRYHSNSGYGIVVYPADALKAMQTMYAMGVAKERQKMRQEYANIAFSEIESLKQKLQYVQSGAKIIEDANDRLRQQLSEKELFIKNWNGKNIELKAENQRLTAEVDRLKGDKMTEDGLLSLEYVIRLIKKAWEAGYDRCNFENCEIDELVIPKETADKYVDYIIEDI